MDVTAGSGRHVWWRCAANDMHEWDAPASRRAAGSGCPFCFDYYRMAEPVPPVEPPSGLLGRLRAIFRREQCLGDGGYLECDQTGHIELYGFHYDAEAWREIYGYRREPLIERVTVR
jgi:hypothetical protein